jgi:hypothetical protein
MKMVIWMGFITVNPTRMKGMINIHCTNNNKIDRPSFTNMCIFATDATVGIKRENWANMVARIARTHNIAHLWRFVSMIAEAIIQWEEI